jgi:PadR family transcriptional regulator PadR
MNKDDLNVIEAMLADPLAWHYGLGLSAAAKIPFGTIYPVFARLEKARWLESCWDAGNSVPRRRLYRLTGFGQRCGATALADRAVPAEKRRRCFGFELPLPQGELG